MEKTNGGCFGSVSAFQHFSERVKFTAYSFSFGQIYLSVEVMITSDTTFYPVLPSFLQSSKSSICFQLISTSILLNQHFNMCNIFERKDP